MTSRKSSGTIIVPREHPRVELKEGDEVFDKDDARAMSPRRSSQDLEKMGQEAREQLNKYVSHSITSPTNIKANTPHQTRQSPPEVTPRDIQSNRSRKRGAR